MPRPPKVLKTPPKTFKTKHFFERLGLKSHQGGARPPSGGFSGQDDPKKCFVLKFFGGVFNIFGGRGRAFLGFFSGIGKTLKIGFFEGFRKILISQYLAVLGIMDLHET